MDRGSTIEYLVTLLIGVEGLWKHSNYLFSLRYCVMYSAA